MRTKLLVLLTTSSESAGSSFRPFRSGQDAGRRYPGSPTPQRQRSQQQNRSPASTPVPASSVQGVKAGQKPPSPSLPHGSPPEVAERPHGLLGVLWTVGRMKHQDGDAGGQCSRVSRASPWSSWAIAGVVSGDISVVRLLLVLPHAPEQHRNFQITCLRHR